MKIDVCIPTYKPDQRFLVLLDRLAAQSIPVQKVILYNTEEKYFEGLVMGTNFYDRYKNVEVHHISRHEFDHGHTRNELWQHSEADIVVFMTQDAIPADEYLLEHLICPLTEGTAELSYARQLAAEDAGASEQFTRSFNYPPESRIKSIQDMETLGIKTFFCSNVCAAYKRETLEQYHGFVNHTIFNEDMIFASGVIRNGGRIAYTADARVVHSHHYTNQQQFRRNFDLAVSQAKHPDVFKGISSESEGIRYVRAAYTYFKEHHCRMEIVPFVVACGYRYMGYRKGKKYHKLPDKVIMKCTMNKEYWRYSV